MVLAGYRGAHEHRVVLAGILWRSHAVAALAGSGVLLCSMLVVSLWRSLAVVVRPRRLWRSRAVVVVAGSGILLRIWWRSQATVAPIIKKPPLAALAQRSFGGVHEAGPGF